MWPPSERRKSAIQDAASGTIDWDKFLLIVKRQRVPGLAHDGLKRAGIALPAGVYTRLAAEASNTVRQALQLAFEAVRIQAALDAAAIPVLFIKGSALALLAYGNLGIKHAWDIDMLVRPDQVLKACKVLLEAGYVRTVPPSNFGDEPFFAWTEFAHEIVFHNEARASYIELHWRLSNSPALLSHISACSSSRSVTVYADQALRTLNDEDMFTYLCHHGAHHAWSRLKWLSDLCAWISPKPPQEIERLYRRAKADGAGRAAAQALLLCERLLAMPLEPEFSAELKSDRIVRWLATIALDAMAGGGSSRPTEDRLLGNLQIELSHFLLATGVRHWMQELQAKSIGWTDFQRFRLPRPLFFLYPVLRVPSWIWRRGARLLRQSR